MFNNKSILITGGTGSFGNAAVSYLTKKYKRIKRLIIFSRDELKQHEMSKTYNIKKYPYIRYFLGDIRDYHRLVFALKNVDYVIHAAALKHVPIAEYNPFEFVKTNIIGSQNLIDSCIVNKVKKIIALSTDKASSPINLYGATKLCADKQFIAANNIVGNQKTSFSIVRYGNVMGSRGSVIPIFLRQKIDNEMTITDPKMTRFNITLNESVEMVEWAFKNLVGGEILVPKIPSYRILDLAKAISPNCKIKITGLREGEKVNEELINNSEAACTFSLNKYFIILPNDQTIQKKILRNLKSYKKVNSKFNFISDKNKFLSIHEIKNILKKNKLV